MIRFAVVAALFAGPAAAQEASVATAADIAATIARVRAGIRPDQPMATAPVLAFGGYRAVLEYRQAGAPAAVHKTQAEVFHVVEGAGRMVTGGALEGGRAVDAANDSGSGIAGGTARRVAAGDMMVVPAGVAHWFPAVEGRLVLVTMKVPMAAPTP